MTEKEKKEAIAIEFAKKACGVLGVNPERARSFKLEIDALGFTVATFEVVVTTAEIEKMFEG